MKSLIYYLCLVALVSSCKSKTKDTVLPHDTMTISSIHTNEDRVINVWMPESYKSNPNKQYPVLYMADGGVKEDFPHIANTLDKLIKENKIPPHLLVGIENTERHRDLTGRTEVEYDLTNLKGTGGADNFRSFIKEELIPTIEQKYHVNKERALIGESLAGLFVVETFFVDNSIFNKYIAMDPSLWFNNRYLVKNAASHIQENYPSTTKLWFAGSSAKDISDNTRLLNKTLDKFSSNLLWKYSDEPKEEHHTIFRATKEKAIIWSLGN